MFSNDSAGIPQCLVYTNLNKAPNVLFPENNTMALHARMKRELEMLSQDPPHGVAAWPKDDCLTVIEARTNSASHFSCCLQKFKVLKIPLMPKACSNWKSAYQKGLF